MYYLQIYKYVFTVSADSYFLITYFGTAHAYWVSQNIHAPDSYFLLAIYGRSHIFEKLLIC